MSFDQLASLEAGTSTSGHAPAYTDDPQFQKQSRELMNKLFKLTGNNQRLRGEISHLGTKRDTPRVRERVHGLLDESRDLFREVGDGLKTLQKWENVTPSQRYSQQKISRELQTALSEFQNLQRQALEKERASVSAARAALGSESGPDPAAAATTQQEQQELQQQQQLQNLASQDEVDFQEALIIEREEEIRNIEQGVGDLNVLFTQVAQIVTEQGEQLDTIENNVENVRTDTRGADYELRAAARYQKQARSKACCLLLILAVILTIVLLAVFLG